MKICKSCGVELDVDMNFCPLCGQKHNERPAKLVNDKKNIPNTNEDQNTNNFEDLTDIQQRRIIWELMAFILVSCTVITLLIDLLIAKQVTWSKYTLTIGMILLLDTSILLFMQKRLVLLFVGLFLSTSLLLFLLDYYDNNLGSGVQMGIPILFFCYLILFSLSLLIRKIKQKGVNIVAYSLIAAGIICMCIEGIVSLHVYDCIKFQWSFIVMVSILPVSAILLYIHHRLSRVTNLKKVFHV